ncbi:MAG: site-specific DNA-methyltransferase [Acidobacteria bacterium]|nr:site-specific DNA-methyltransferase [Acidobacteriota bacterium]
MARKSNLVAEQRKYGVIDVKAAKQVCDVWLQRAELQNAVNYGLPEVDDRYHFWRVPLVNRANQEAVGEIVIDAYTSLILENKSTAPDLLEARLLGRNGQKNGHLNGRATRNNNDTIHLSTLRNTIVQGDSEEALQDLPAGSVDLIFTSPPYYNARPEYTDYLTYEEYLLKIRKVIQQAHRVLAEGRFFVMNVSPVLIRRASRSESSKRIAVPFDMHRLFVEEGYDFIDDILWEKPEGAGWAVGRGRRFAADRNPLQYKAVSVTENILVYRKHTDKLIDWNIRAHPNQSLVKASRIGDDYERTNIWRITPAHDQRHPAIFPVELAKKVISYYSFKEDVVLDPFAGIGTTGKAATLLGRRFVLIEQNPDYVNVIRSEAETWLGEEARQILTINCASVEASDRLF